MLTIGLTGNIASGKSIVSKYLKELGAEIIDADIIAREVVKPGSPALTEIKQEFGQQVTHHNGTLNRKYLGNIVFADPNALKKLNQITHPRIRELINMEIQKHSLKLNSSNKGILIIDAALLIEFGIHKMVDIVWVVQLDPILQLKRLMRRDNLPEAEAHQRINVQMPQSEKVKHATKIISNNGTVEELHKKIRELWDELK
ncbi:dephospho-CoA kinase [Desulfofarcimen acetoxidans DSM 771]|uniref:Dephospho-CoA kinase n=1 Tax=Desulfofarcimen acetoxidans (strain ATCC 49208 / DSM 771 / KCTC 5769 / VKM B-1644 / 5575) TaxID=485916 RepID=C8W0H4_DESAS|nr:dephospho-CoA kinase [Desulfofarcimen acetoxidans]ACV63229.1 dephospho-CoA kinase [Desulfofarcimen acetoxidans DSM 771]